MYSTRKSLVSFASAVVLMLLAAVTQAATRNVPSQYPRLQDAINAAAPGDTILVAAGTYNDYDRFHATEWIGKDLIIKGAGPGKTILQSNGHECCLTTQNLTASSRIEGFTFKLGAQAGGGGMNNTNSSLTVANCEFSDNRAGAGAGMCNQYSNPTVINCTFHSNVADYDGGGMYNERSNPTIINCDFNDNSAGRSGGGMYNYNNSNPTVTNCIFRNHQGFNGGGMANAIYSNPIVTNCLFFNNMAFNDGGGMHNYLYSRPTVTNCTFVQNEALANFGSGHGGAIYSETAEGYGNNSATVTNCILWGNTAAGGDPGIYGSATVTYSDVQGRSNATPDAYGNFAADPLFVNALNGDLHLKLNSPCRDRGNNAVLSSPPFLSVTGGVLVDMDTCRRVSSARVDLGAYEFQSLTDVSAQIKIVKGSVYPGSTTGTVRQTLVITNNGGTCLNGPISLIFTFQPGYTLTSKSGLTSTLTPAGRPYTNLGGISLPPGASVAISLSFTKTGSGTFSYTVQVVDGIGTR